STVLITGESGVGKGLIAARIHKHSQRSEAPFTPINCGAIPETLLESELFGYERGAFTGANKEGKKGLIEVSHGGTVFLDEVAELPLNIQVKLLNLIQEKKYYRVGGNRQVSTDVRFIAATNRNIQKMVSDGTFREDLYYRLNVVPLVIPPLRYRREDIAPLIVSFLKQLNIRFNANKKIAHGVMRILGVYDWPGNVRELENILERLMVTCDEDLITEGHLPDYMLVDRAPASKVVVSDLCPLQEAREELERQLITMAYRKFRNTYDVAKALGVNQSTAVRKMHKYHLAADPVLNVKVRERGKSLGDA
ncbi:MAG TPA: sigma 54-interacting transcriptional regulator, partial [Spirochaetia bacterium]|nr:sigma 54-interacting transcriptional regulator [Spirochaetia bacterium]